MISNNHPPEFPAGEFAAPGRYGAEEKSAFASQLRDAPEKIRGSVEGLNPDQLDSVYKNWTIRQIVHHLADSHMNAYIRFKWALTEASPLIKSYDETKWSEIVDARLLPIEPSLIILDGIHARWAGLIESLDDDLMDKTYFHPEIGGDVALHQALPSYVWHTDHHVAQILWIRNEQGW
jgi:hypothetical protein